jgi:hypothetical protein
MYIHFCSIKGSHSILYRCPCATRNKFFHASVSIGLENDLLKKTTQLDIKLAKIFKGIKNELLLSAFKIALEVVGILLFGWWSNLLVSVS